MYHAFVLCAGSGTRLYPYTDIMSKSMLRVGGIPIIRHIVNKLSTTPYVDKIVICISFKELDDYLYEFRDMPEVKIVTERSVVSTGTTYAKAADEMKIEYGKDTLVYYGDTMIDLDFNKIDSQWEWNKFKNMADAMLICSSNIHHDYSEVMLDTGNDMITKMTEKPRLAFPTWTGIMLMKHMPTYDLDFGYDILPELVRNKKLAGFLSSGEYYDTGNIRAYHKLLELGRQGKFR